MPKKILIADDTKDIRDIAAKILSRFGFNPLLAETCEEAIEAAVKELPDLILLDAQFLNSELQGVDTCRKLKTDERTRRIPIIGTSSPHAYDDDFLEAGAVDYLPKPYTPSELVNIIKKYTGGIKNVKRRTNRIS